LKPSSINYSNIFGNP